MTKQFSYFDSQACFIKILQYSLILKFSLFGFLFFLILQGSLVEVSAVCDLFISSLF